MIISTKGGEGRHLEVGFTHTHSAVLSWVDSSRPSDSSPPGSSVHRILQARILVWSPCPPQHIHTAAAKSLQVVSDSVRPHRRQPTRLLCLSDSPGKNTRVGCHFLLQCMKVKSQSEVAQSCPTLRDPMDYSPPGSSVHRIFQARVLEWGAIAFSNHKGRNHKGSSLERCFREGGTLCSSKRTPDNLFSHESL